MSSVSRSLDNIVAAKLIYFCGEAFPETMCADFAFNASTVKHLLQDLAGTIAPECATLSAREDGSITFNIISFAPERLFMNIEFFPKNSRNLECGISAIFVPFDPNMISILKLAESEANGFTNTCTKIQAGQHQHLFPLILGHTQQLLDFCLIKNLATFHSRPPFLADVD
jgi:hypothetical protein